MPTPEVITTLSPDVVASGSWALPGKSTGSLTHPPSQQTSAAMDAAWPHLLCVEPSRHAFSRQRHTPSLCPTGFHSARAPLCLLGALPGRRSQLSRAPQPYVSPTWKACHRLPPNMWPRLHAALCPQVTACPLQPPPASPGRAAQQEGSATVPALPHPGARACAVPARLSTAPLLQGCRGPPPSPRPHCAGPWMRPHCLAPTVLPLPLQASLHTPPKRPGTATFCARPAQGHLTSRHYAATSRFPQGCAQGPNRPPPPAGQQRARARL